MASLVAARQLFSPTMRPLGLRYYPSYYSSRTASLIRRPIFRRSALSVMAVMATHVHDFRPDFGGPHVRIQTTSSSRILAHSSAISLGEDSISKRLGRFFRYLRQLVQSLYNLLLVTLRGSEVALRLSPLVILTPVSVISSRLQFTFISDWTWNYVTYSMQALGPAFVKLCQWMATRRDIFPPHVCDRLGRLHDRGIPHAWDHTHSLLTEAFGDYRAQGLVIQPNDVIGCGSAAQVYKGILNMSDEQQLSVAVKVLHPRFERLVQRDLWFLQTVTELLHSLPIGRLRMLNLPRAAENFGSILKRQADLRIEGENLQQFRSNFYRNEQEEAISAITFPRPIDGWISRSVLVEDLVVDGTPIAEYLREGTDEGTEIRKELASPLLQAFLKMVFLDNFVHCDLHPGNVLIRTSFVKPKAKSSFWGRWSTTTNEAELGGPVEIRRTLVFLDAGIATSLSPDDQRNLRDLFRAVILNDGNQAGRLMVERAKYERCSTKPGGVDEFAAGIDELVREFHDRRREGLTLGAVRIGSLLSRVLDLCREYGVEIDPSMASIVLSTLVLEGLGRSLEPQLNLIDFAVPFILGRGRV